MNRLKLIYSSALAAITSIVFVVAITIVAEQSAGLKSYLKALSGHHWTSKSFLTLAVYFVVLLVIYFTTKEPVPRYLRKVLLLVPAFAIAGYVILLAFFLGHYY